MFFIRSLLFLLVLILPVSVSAGVSADDLPTGTLWYLHADLKQMRNTDSGRELYRWLDDEVFEEIHEEVGFDINKEADSVTAFSDAVNGIIILIDGPLSGDSQQKMIDLARTAAELTEYKYKGKDYFFVQDDDSDNDEHGSREPLDDLKDGAYFSFAIKNKLLISGNEKQMKELLANKGKVTGSKSHQGSLFVLTADHAFIQAGLDTSEIADDDDDWDSNILRNTKQVALTIADRDGMLSIDVELVSIDPKMTQSIGGIVSGLISLQAFNSDLNPELKSLLINTKVDVKENVLSISMVIPPGTIVSVLN